VWSAPAPIDDVPGLKILASDSGLQLTGTERGGAVAMWTRSDRDGPSSQIWANVYRPGDGWQLAQLVAEGEQPQVVIAESGQAFATWRIRGPGGINATFYRGRYVPGQGWIDVAEMTGALDAGWAVARNGRALLVSMTKESVVVQDFDPATGFSAEEAIGMLHPGAENGGAEIIHALVDSQADAIVFWKDGYSVGRQSVTVLSAARRVAGFGWQPPESGSNDFPMGGDDHGNVLRVWPDSWRAVTSFVRLTLRDGWSAPQDVPAPGGFFPRSLALSSAGAGVLLLADESRQFAAVGYDPEKGWGQAGVLSGVQEARSSDATVAVDGAGRGMAIWTEDIPAQVRSVWIADVAPWGRPQRLTPDTGARPEECPGKLMELIPWRPAVTLDDHGGGVAVWSEEACEGSRILSSFRSAGPTAFAGARPVALAE
jgi:hypothetical protein